MCSYTTVIFLLLVFLHLVDGTSMPQWKMQLVHFHKWNGHYLYGGRSHACSMVVHSVQDEDYGGAIVSFAANNTRIAMSAFSQDNIRIVFKHEAIFEPGDHFFEELEFVVELLHFGNAYLFLGNITRPSSNFSSIRLQPEGTSGGTTVTESHDLSVGLAVGISLFLFIICTVIGIVILRWAVRKGYLRHVARSYKSFRNPDTPVSFDNAQEGGQRCDVNVHI